MSGISPMVRILEMGITFITISGTPCNIYQVQLFKSAALHSLAYFWVFQKFHKHFFRLSKKKFKSFLFLT
jgi:hypothetical protein